jgi:glyoxylase-like metal-dependent hydrolase (beta-lactamase superfamily II)
MIAADEFQTITPRVFSWQAYDPRVKCDLSSVALQTTDGLVLVDPIPLRDEALDELTRGRPVRAILLTSGNHERAAESYRKRFNVPVWASEEAARSVEITVDHSFKKGELAPGGMSVVELFAAGPGEVALVGDGLVCLGDAVINLASHGFSLLPAKYCVNSRLLPNDLRKLLSYEFRILTFAHGDPLIEHARERLQQLLA